MATEPDTRGTEGTEPAEGVAPAEGVVPVAGAGNDAAVVIVRADVTLEPLDERTAREAVDAPDAGAVVLFSGVVRDHDEGRGVDRLSYTAHPSATATLRGVVEAVIGEHRAAFGESERAMRVWIAHRVGELAVGDAAFVCAVSSAHRGEAFRLCSDLVDRVKAEVPIWKEQFFDDGGSEWVAALG